MSPFVDFERQVVRVLLGSHMPIEQVDELLEMAEFVSCEHTGVGYFLTVRHQTLPTLRVVCHTPLIVGRAQDIECGFVIFLEGGELTLECHSWGDESLPADLRDRPLAIEAAA